MAYQVYTHTNSFSLESGRVLQQFQLAYTTHGELNETRDNVVWVFHALTANSDPSEWWPGLIGEGKLFDPSNYFIVCVNMPGSCYGSVGPLDIDPQTGKPYYHHFPFFTTRDMIRAYQQLRLFLGIKSVYIGIGGSMGGQQLLEWSIEEPTLFEYIFPIATNAKHSAWAIAFNASQRLSIELDPSWVEESEQAGIQGMKVARSIALISYRHYNTYGEGQSEITNDPIEHFKSESYQRYQGEKLARRFNAFSYYFLSKGMDAHNVGRGRMSIEDTLRQIKAKTLVIGIETDILFPLSEQRYLATHIPGAVYLAIQSPYGHDGFLLEYEQITNCINDFILSGKASMKKLAVIN